MVVMPKEMERTLGQPVLLSASDGETVLLPVETVMAEEEDGWPRKRDLNTCKNM